MAAAPAWLSPVLDKRPAIERVLGMPLGRMFACGMFGCAFDTTDPWAVKLTMDETEAPIWVLMQEFQREDPEGSAGLARVRDIVRLRPDAKHGRKKVPVFAIIREEIGPIWAAQEGYFSDLSLRHLDVPEELWEDVRFYRSLWDPGTEDRVPPETWERMVEMRQLLEGLMLFRVAAVHHYAALGEHGSGIEAARRALKMSRAENEAAAKRGFREALALMDNPLASPIRNSLAGLGERYGVFLRDVHWENIGWRTTEVFDGESLPIVPIVFDPGFTPSTGAAAIREALVANGPDAPEPEDLRGAIYCELLLAEDVRAAFCAPASALARLTGNAAGPSAAEIARSVLER